MSVEVKVQGVNHGKTQKGKDKTQLFDGKNWFNLLGKVEGLEGKTVNLKPTGFRDWYELAFIADEKSETGNGSALSTSSKIEWSIYMDLVRSAHDLAKDLEPDIPGEGGALLDRSEARRAIVNTILIAHSNGAFEFPETPF